MEIKARIMVCRMSNFTRFDFRAWAEIVELFGDGLDYEYALDPVSLFKSLINFRIIMFQMTIGRNL